MPEIDDAAVIALFMQSYEIDREIAGIDLEILTLKARVKEMMREAGVEDHGDRDVLDTGRQQKRQQTATGERK